MKRLFLLFNILFFVTFSFAQQYNSANLEVDYSEHNSTKTHYTYKNLRLYPIKAKESFLKSTQNQGKHYLSLQKALKSKKVSITEQGRTNNTSNNRNNNLNNIQDTDVNNNINNIQIQQNNLNNSFGGGAVNNLSIENTSQDTLYIMAGEVVQGGKQDRVIAKDMIIPPNSGKVNLSVFCVEKGRWSYKDDGTSFDTYYGFSSTKLRGVVEKKQSQDEVWSEVSRSNNENSVKTTTQAYTAQIQSREFREEQEKYLNFFKDKFNSERNVIGVVVVSGNNIVGCDMFSSPYLFQSQFSSLLRGYISEAITDGKEVVISKQKVENYMAKLLNPDEQEGFLDENGTIFQKGTKKLRVSTFR